MFTALNTPVTAAPDRIVSGVRTQLNQKEATRMDSPLSQTVAARGRGVAFVLTAVTAIAALILVACGGGDEVSTDVAGESAGPSALDYGSLSGEIRIDGSSARLKLPTPRAQ